MDTRVQDYLDDKLQSAADLESLDSLLENVRSQQELLRKQLLKLQDARRDHNEAQTAAQSHTQTIKQKAHAFQEEQSDIDTRLMIVTQSETSDDAVQQFESSMARLRKLDVAAEYVELLKEVDTLSSESVARLGKDNDAALEPYRRLQQLVSTLQPLQEVAEGAAPHLLDHIVANVQNLRRTIQTAFSNNLEQTLKKMNWPKSTDRVPLALEKEWFTNVGRLLDLQKQDLEARNSHNPNDDPLPLLPFEVLVLPLEQRFNYHFSGNKPTNRLEKPEYFLNHVIELVANYSDFVQDNLQPVLLRHFRGSDLAFTPAYIDCISAFITALIPMIKTKLYSTAEQLSNQPALLSHLVQEVIQFDKTLQDSYSYTPNSPSLPWRGLSYFLLDTCGYFPKWLDAERDFALQRYHAIVNSSEAGELDYDSVSADASKPTKAAIRVNDLLETITERYRNLASFSQKVKFLIDIQIEIFDQYYKRLQSGLEAYQTLTSTVGRTMHGMSKDEQAKVSGVHGLDRICRVFGSADYLERAMRDWSDDVFFLELWAELDYRSKNSDQVGKNMGSWQDVQRKTSAALGAEEYSGLEGALFDETASSYSRVRVRSEAVLSDTLTYDVRQALRPYGSVSTWASLSTSTAGGSVSAELDPMLSLLTQYFGFLRKALGKAPLRRVSRHVCHVIQSYIWDNILSRSSFSTTGATQLTADLRAICNSIDRYVGAGQAQMGMRRLLEGATLLSLPVKGEIERIKPGDEEDEAAAWDDAREAEDGKTMSLFQAERLVFMDNESARHALEQLGLETLSEADARSVLGRRVEISS